MRHVAKWVPSATSSAQGQLKRLHAPERQALVPLELLQLQAEVGEPGEERSDGRLRFHARQGGAEAEVGAGTEGEVLVVWPADVQAVGAGEVFRVAVGGTQGRQHDVAA